MASLVKSLPRLQYPPGAVVIAQGDILKDIFIIHAGEVEVVLKDGRGGERRLNHCTAGSTLGEMSFFSRQPASATVRATTDVTLLVLDEAGFLHWSRAFPQLYRNLGAILTNRLVQTNRLAVPAASPQVTLLSGQSAEPLLGYALAASMAWHTRDFVLLIHVSDRSPSAELLSLATADPWRVHWKAEDLWTAQSEGNGRAEPRAHLLLARPQGAFAADQLIRTVDACSRRYSHVLVQTQGDVQAPPFPRRIVLGELQTAPARPAEGAPLLTLCAGQTGKRGPYPDAKGELAIPALQKKDEQALRKGLLPLSTPAGQAIGRAARHVAHLRVGLALGGGADKGWAHFGALRVLERIGLPVDYLAGTSAGAMVAAAWAMKFDEAKSLEYFASIARKVFRLTWPTTSFLSSGPVRTYGQQIMGNTRIEDLDVPLGIVAVDLLLQQEVVFRRGLLWQAVMASSALPGIYPPECVGRYLLVDGAILNPVPCSVVKHMGADVVVGIKLNKAAVSSIHDAEAIESKGRRPWALQTLMRTFDIMLTKVESAAGNEASILIEPQFPPGTTMSLRDFHRDKGYIELGEQAAEAALPRLQAAFPWLRS